MEKDKIRSVVFDQWIEAARGVTVRQELERRGLWSRSMAGDNGGRCPGCGGTDRFSVNTRKNVWLCRASGAAGDAIALAQHIDGVDFLRAVEIVTGRPPPDRASGLTDDERRAIEERAEKLARDQEAKLLAAEQSSARFRERERAEAFLIWQSGVPVTGTLAEDYLALRGLTVPRGAHLRFCPKAEYWDKPKHQGGRIVHEGPAMLAAIAAPDGRFSGLHRTWIDLAKPNGKAVIVQSETGEILPAKKVRGSVKGGSILLIAGGVDADFPGDRRGPQTFFLGEGIETVLSVANFLDARPSPFLHWLGAEFRSGVSLGNICGKAAGRARHPTETRQDSKGRVRPHFVPDNEPLNDPAFPIIPIAESISELVLLGDGDSEPFFTRLALERAGARFARAYPHLLVRLWNATPGKDFNEMWAETCAKAQAGSERAPAHA